MLFSGKTNKFIGNFQFWRIRGLISLRKGGRKLTYIRHYDSENQVSYAVFPEPVSLRKLRVPCNHTLPSPSLFEPLSRRRLNKNQACYVNLPELKAHMKNVGRRQFGNGYYLLTLFLHQRTDFLGHVASWIPINGIKLLVTSRNGGFESTVDSDSSSKSKSISTIHCLRLKKELSAAKLNQNK